MGNSLNSFLVCPCKSPAEISLIPEGFTTVSPSCFAQLSTAQTPRTSVAVVIAACAPVIFASLLARRFAPPRCPDKIGCTSLPFIHHDHSRIALFFPDIRRDRTYGDSCRTDKKQIVARLKNPLCPVRQTFVICPETLCKFPVCSKDILSARILCPSVVRLG